MTGASESDAGREAESNEQREIQTVRLSSAPSASGLEDRFPPGTVLAERYRIVTRVGRGGMGEVYRADDLKLGQSVALKFLPAAMATDGRSLQRFHEEVRIAREVAHPNICRVYDIAETEGQHFISMEYIDGEDLDSLLKRIGRLPKDKGIQIARQLCAGLAASHDKGVLHRDLKPANVMIDGRGNVRITDFGIAALADQLGGGGGLAGTPAYMAPEQLEGARVTVRSDLYALGLVLYEIFTGREPFEGDSLEQLRRSRSTSASRPSSYIDDMDPVVEQAIMRCLEPDPDDRPSSAIAVAASLPGGDPLALAIAAGETPSPEMVAHAGIAGSLRPRVAVAMLACTVVLLAAAVYLAARGSVLHYRGVELPPAVLVDRVRQCLAVAGHEVPAPHEAWHFDALEEPLDWLARSDESPGRWSRLAEGFPSPILLHYRGAREAMVAANIDGQVRENAPPFSTAGMTNVQVDGEGRLRLLEVIPDERLPGETAVPPDWTTLLRAAGFEPGVLGEAEPAATPTVYCVDRMAWEGAWPDDPALPVRVEAGAVAGHAVFFKVLFPWDLPEGQPASAKADPGIVFVPMIVLVLALASFLAWRNLRHGRGDQRGATRLAAFIIVTYVLMWLAEADHVFGLGEMTLFARGIGRALTAGAVCWLLYVAVEPYARRYWPHVLVSWTRLLGGRWRDPLVGRDVLAGSLAGVAFFGLASSVSAVGRAAGVPPPPPAMGNMDALIGGRRLVGAVLQAQTGIGFFLGIFVLLLVLRVVLRRQLLASVAFVIVTALPLLLVLPGGVVSAFSLLIFLLGMLFIVLRLGLLALLVLAVIGPLTTTFPTTLDTNAWYFTNGLMGPLAVLAVAVAGFWISLGGQPLFRDELA